MVLGTAGETMNYWHIFPKVSLGLWDIFRNGFKIHFKYTSPTHPPIAVSRLFSNLIELIARMGLIRVNHKLVKYRKSIYRRWVDGISHRTLQGIPGIYRTLIEWVAFHR